MGFLEFDKFLGFIFFTTMALAGFWCLKFLALSIGPWIQMWFGAKGKEKKGIDLREPTRPTFADQEDVEVIFQK